jgi:hypothetical protein
MLQNLGLWPKLICILSGRIEDTIQMAVPDAMSFAMAIGTTCGLGIFDSKPLSWTTYASFRGSTYRLSPIFGQESLIATPDV